MKSLSQRITEARGECWHTFKKTENELVHPNHIIPSCIHCEIMEGMARNPNYEQDANKYMMLFQELPYPYRNLMSNGVIDKPYFCGEIDWDAEMFGEGFTGRIGTAVCLAWLEAFKCKECVDGFVFDEGGSGICNVPCPKCNNGSTFKKEGG